MSRAFGDEWFWGLSCGFGGVIRLFGWKRGLLRVLGRSLRGVIWDLAWL